MALSQITADSAFRNQPLLSTAIQHNEPMPKLAQAEFPIELLFPGLIVFALAFIGYSKARPVDTDDIYAPDIRRQEARAARAKRRSKVKWAK